MCDIFDIIKISRMINNSQAPILYIGSDLKNSEINDFILDFATKNRIPFFTTSNAAKMIRHNDIFYRGILDFYENNDFDEIFNKSDMLIIIGTDSDTSAENINGRFKSGKIIYIKNDSINESKIEIEKSYLAGNIKYIFKNLNPLINTIDRKEWINHLKKTPMIK